MLLNNPRQLRQVMLAIILVILSAIPAARAGSLLASIQKQDTCGTTYADRLASCTPFQCNKPSPLAIIIPSESILKKMSPKQRKQIKARLESVENRLKKMTPEKRAELKERMNTHFEIRGFDAQKRCRTVIMASPKYRQDCTLDKSTLERVSAYTKLAATAKHIQTKSTSHLVNGKMVTEQKDIIDGKPVSNPLQQAFRNGQCKMLEKDPDLGWVPLEQANRMSHFEFSLSEHGKQVDGHIQISHTSDQKILFDKDVRTSLNIRKINLRPGTFDVKIVSNNPKLAPVFFRKIKLGTANLFRKNIEFYAITGTLKLNVNIGGNPSKGAAIYIKDPATKKWLGKWSTWKKSTFLFTPASVKLPETLTGRYQVFVAAVPAGVRVPNGAKYKHFLFTIKNGETIEKTISFGESATANTKSNRIVTDKAPARMVPLELYWSGKNQDNFVTSTQKGAEEALAAGYQRRRTEACVIAADTDVAHGNRKYKPLKLFWSQERGDYFSAVSARGEHDAKAAGYRFVRVEGFILPFKQPGTVPIKLYWSSRRRDNFTVATLQGVRSAKAEGYRFSRIQGYVFPASKCQNKTSGR